MLNLNHFAILNPKPTLWCCSQTCQNWRLFWTEIASNLKIHNSQHFKLLLKRTSRLLQSHSYVSLVTQLLTENQAFSHNKWKLFDIITIQAIGSAFAFQLCFYNKSNNFLYFTLSAHVWGHSNPINLSRIYQLSNSVHSPLVCLGMVLTNYFSICG